MLYWRGPWKSKPCTSIRWARNTTRWWHSGLLISHEIYWELVVLHLFYPIGRRNFAGYCKSSVQEPACVEMYLNDAEKAKAARSIISSKEKNWKKYLSDLAWKREKHAYDDLGPGYTILVYRFAARTVEMMNQKCHNFAKRAWNYCKTFKLGQCRKVVEVNKCAKRPLLQTVDPYWELFY